MQGDRGRDFVASQHIPVEVGLIVGAFEALHVGDAAGLELIDALEEASRGVEALVGVDDAGELVADGIWIASRRAAMSSSAVAFILSTE